MDNIENFGKKVSYTLCIINLVLFVAPFIGIIVPGLVTFDTAAIFTSNFILDCTWLVMALNALVMTMAKYTDKAIRKGESNSLN